MARQVILLYVSIYLFSAVGFAFLLSVFFSNAVLAAVVGPIALFAAILPKYVFFGSNRYEQAGAKGLSSLLSPTAFAFGAEILGDYEYEGIGINPSNWHTGESSLFGCKSAH